MKRGLNRKEAAEYIGVGSTKFDELVKVKRMPAPRLLSGIERSLMSSSTVYPDNQMTMKRKQVIGIKNENKIEIYTCSWQWL